MIKPDTAQQIPLNEPLAKILRLHGEPFVDLLEGTSFQPGEPAVRVSEGLRVPPHIHDIVSRIIELQQIYSPTDDLDGPCYGNTPSLALVLYNLVKNPLKRAYMLSKPLPAVDVWIGPSSDGNCSSIFIRDEGLGFSFDELRAKFTKEAFDKFEAGTPLSFIEECLIDEALQEHIPFKTYADLVCNRGATTGGGTGIGLSVAKEIIETGHQGMLRLYNHPRKGAGVQILLPNVDNTVPAKQRKQITRASLQHQLQHGLKE